MNTLTTIIIIFVFIAIIGISVLVVAALDKPTVIPQATATAGSYSNIYTTLVSNGFNTLTSTTANTPNATNMMISPNGSYYLMMNNTGLVTVDLISNLSNTSVKPSLTMGGSAASGNIQPFTFSLGLTGIISIQDNKGNILWQSASSASNTTLKPPFIFSLSNNKQLVLTDSTGTQVFTISF